MSTTDSAAPRRVLLVEDDASMRAILRVNLDEVGCEVREATRGDEALRLIEATVGDPTSHFQLIVTDVKMPGADGMAVLRAARARQPDAQVVLVTAFGTVERAIEAMAAGAADYITKPFRRAEFKARIGQALERAHLVRENRELRSRAGAGGGLAIVTASPRLLEVLRVVDRVATADVTVLVTGESGTGKELIARRLHDGSGRRGAFVPVNCAALPAGMLESELFGHERGAFTGAERRHQGKFERADGGTLFLDEIGELPIELQAKLLRVIEERSIDRLGGRQRVPIDVRVVAATNRDLGAEAAAGRFREDLYHRLGVIPIELPPLRRRPEDIPLLLAQFLRDGGQPGVTLAPALVDELMGRPWPGNVRELKNLVARMVLLRRGDHLDLADLAPPGVAAGGGGGAASESAPASGPAPPGAASGDGGAPAAASGLLRPGELVLPDEGFDLFGLEREIIDKALERHAGNRSATARYLGIPRHVLLYRLSKVPD